MNQKKQVCRLQWVFGETKDLSDFFAKQMTDADRQEIYVLSKTGMKMTDFTLENNMISYATYPAFEGTYALENGTLTPTANPTVTSNNIAKEYDNKKIPVPYTNRTNQRLQRKLNEHMIDFMNARDNDSLYINFADPAAPFKERQSDVVIANTTEYPKSGSINVSTTNRPNYLFWNLDQGKLRLFYVYLHPNKTDAMNNNGYSLFEYKPMTDGFKSTYRAHAIEILVSVNQGWFNGTPIEDVDAIINDAKTNPTQSVLLTMQDTMEQVKDALTLLIPQIQRLNEKKEAPATVRTTHNAQPSLTVDWIFDKEDFNTAYDVLQYTFKNYQISADDDQATLNVTAEGYFHQQVPNLWKDGMQFFRSKYGQIHYDFKDGHQSLKPLSPFMPFKAVGAANTGAYTLHRSDHFGLNGFMLIGLDDRLSKSTVFSANEHNIVVGRLRDEVFNTTTNSKGSWNVWYNNMLAYFAFDMMLHINDVTKQPEIVSYETFKQGMKGKSLEEVRSQLVNLAATWWFQATESDVFRRKALLFKLFDS